MKIGINLALANIQAGVGIYSKKLIENLLKVDKENEYFLFSPQDLNLNGDNINIIKVKNFRSRARRIMYENFQLHSSIKKLDLDIFHSPHFILPKGIKTKSVITVHDMVYKLFNHTLPYSKSLYYNLLMPESLKKVSAIITISNTTRNIIASEYPHLKDKIFVTYLSSGFENFTNTDPAQSEEIIKKYNIKGPYILFVSTIEPRKNLEGLLTALNYIERKDIKLVIVGSLGWKYKNVFRILKKYNLSERVIFTNSVSNEEIKAIYSKSEAFIYPSFYEGFGIPILEAMRAGTPVITSGLGATKEVAGDAALFINPYNPDSITNAINTLLSNDRIRTNLTKKGFERIKQFSWEKTALETLKIYKQIVSG
ncbi:glycosyltransferase family 4 protein [candidate division KSB1 bacterium]